MFKKHLKRILKILVSLAFLFWVIFKVDWFGVLKDLETIKWEYLFLYVAAILGGMLICSYKWKVLANYKKIDLTLGDFFKYYLTGTFINNFMPSFIGGDTFKAYETGKGQGRYIEAASAVVMDRIVGVFSATILALLFTLINISSVLHDRTLVIVNIIVLISFMIDITIMVARHWKFWGRFKKYLPEKLSAFMIDMGTYSADKNLFKKVILLAFAFYFVGIAIANYILFAALGIRINIVDYLSVIFLISIISSVPVSINNIGIKEWAYITFFGAFGVSAGAAVTVAIISRLVQMLLSFFALPVYLQSRK